MSAYLEGGIFVTCAIFIAWSFRIITLFQELIEVLR